MLNEMEVTGQAFEDMQEQNSRLIQQLREKDDANFKLMSERIKSNQVTFHSTILNIFTLCHLDSKQHLIIYLDPVSGHLAVRSQER